MLLSVATPPDNCPPSMTVCVKDSLASDLLSIISSTVSLDINRIILTGLEKETKI